MKIPEVLDICGTDYSIVQSKDLKKTLIGIAPETNKDETYYGYFDPDTQTIYLDSNRTQIQKEKTLIHEIIEALNSDLALSLSHDNIDRLEHGIYYTLTKNKLLK